jgi:hypothetical protein
MLEIILFRMNTYRKAGGGRGACNPPLFTWKKGDGVVEWQKQVPIA